MEKLIKMSTEGKCIDMSQWVTYIAFDIIGDFTLSMQFGCAGNSGNHPWVAFMVN
jgi:hypothetical protein